MIEKGHLIVDGYVDEVMRKARQSVLLQVRVSDRIEEAAKLLEQSGLVSQVDIVKGTIEPRLKPDVQDYSPLPRMLIEHGFQLTLFREEEVNLETAFLALTKGLVQ
jgi:ABC-2 type transport system ATP-binding protein